MSKKPKRAKQARRAQQARSMKQLRQGISILSQMYEQEQWVSRVEQAKEQMLTGDFAGCVSICEPLLDALPRYSELRLDVLSLLGLAHGMLKHYQKSYEVFTEAIDIAPTKAEFWNNRGLACFYLARFAEAVQYFEHAVELSKNDTGEMARRFALQLEEGRRELQVAMQAHGTAITLDQYTERENLFTQGVSLVRQEKWPEAELLFRQLTEMESGIPPYWGNLGVCLLMQFRYDEAEKALKQALAIDANYAVARDNLKQLPDIRRSKEPVAHKLINPYQEREDAKQSLALYKENDEGEIATYTTIEKIGHAVTRTWRPLGKQHPRHNFFLNTYTDTRFTSCPNCTYKTRPRKFFLVVNVNPKYSVIVDKICRYCYHCDLLIVHQDQLEDRLATQFMTINPEIIGNDYQVIGTLDRAAKSRMKQDTPSIEQVVEDLHDFKEVIAFKRVPVAQ